MKSQDTPTSDLRTDPGQHPEDGKSADHIETAKRHWQLIVDAIPQLLCLVDGNGRIIRANRTLERWGLGEVAMIKGASLHGTLHPGCSAPDCYLLGFEHHVLSDMHRGSRAQIEAFDPILQRHLSINFQPTLAEEGHPDLANVLALVSIDDISQTKHAEQRSSKLHANLRHRIVEEVARRIETEDVQARLLNILSKTPNFIAMATLDGSLLYLNQSARSMLQLPVDEDFSHLRIFDFLTPDARETMHEEALPVASSAGVWSGSSELVGRHGRRTPTNQVVIAYRNADGRCDGYSFVEQDMTSWIQAEAALRDSQEEARHLADQLLNVQENERQRIAGDLHDVIGQSLSLIKLSIENIAIMLDEGAIADAAPALNQLSAKVKNALVEVRRVSMDLRPPMLDDLGILPTLSWFFREFESACPNISVRKTISVEEAEIPGPLKTTIFRLLQEATTNIVKHADAAQITVTLVSQSGMLELSVTDNGQGFDPLEHFKDERGERGVGLRSMRERARFSGGIYTLKSTIGQGTSIHIIWPILPACGD